MTSNNAVLTCDRCGDKIKNAPKGKFLVHCPACISELNYKYEHMKKTSHEYSEK